MVACSFNTGSDTDVFNADGDFFSHVVATQANAGLCPFESTGSVPDSESEARDKS